MAEFVCDHCAKPFRKRPAAVGKGKKYCSIKCRSEAENWSSTNTTGMFTCPACGKELTRDSFDWYERAGKPKRFPYCKVCKPKKRRSYHDVGAQAKHQREYVKRCLDAGGDIALSWYFTRNLSQYRARSKKRGLPECNLDADYLVTLFHAQAGKCYYTGETLTWDNHGNIVARKDSMSVDRLIPELGYVRGNVVICGYTTNTSKGDRTEADFYSFCERILKVKAERQAGATPC
jgi:hypothetical protein